MSLPALRRPPDSTHPPPPPSLPRRPHGSTPLTPHCHAPAAPAAALGHESPRGSRVEQLPEPRPRRGWEPRWPGRGRGAGGRGRGGRRRGEMWVVRGCGVIYFEDSTFLCVSVPVSLPPCLSYFRPSCWYLPFSLLRGVPAFLWFSVAV